MFTPLQFIKVQKLMNLNLKMCNRLVLYLTHVHMLFAFSIFCAGSHHV